MAALHPRYTKEEFARRGDAIFERHIRPRVGAGGRGKFVAIDIETGAYEIDPDEIAASDRLLAPTAECPDLAGPRRYPRGAALRPTSAELTRLSPAS